VTDFHGAKVDEVVCGGHCGDVGCGWGGVRAEAGVASGAAGSDRAEWLARSKIPTYVCTSLMTKGL
jgi:hypothetical protein